MYLGLKPLYFRPPYGSYNDLVIKVLGERGYKKMFIWNAVTGMSPSLHLGNYANRSR